MTTWVLTGDCVESMQAMPDCSIDAVVTDPPYGLSREPDIAEVLRHWLAGDDYVHKGGGFMGKSWDSFVPGPSVWREVLRVLKPGGHALVFSGSRTYDLSVIAMRIAGFEIRDQLAWIYSNGLPKSLDVAKAIDKKRDDEDGVRSVCDWLRARMRERGITSAAIAESFGFHSRMVDHWAARDTDSQPSTPTLEQWDRLRGMLGFDDSMDAEVLRLNLRKGEPGDAWKDRPVTGRHAEISPSVTYTLTSRDGLARDDAVSAEAQQWAGWGTALKPAQEPIVLARKPWARGHTVSENVLAHGTGGLNIDASRIGVEGVGRWPTNVMLDEDAAAVLDEQSAGASRFFYVAKASRSEREAGLESAGLPVLTGGELTDREDGSEGLASPRAGAGRKGGRRNNHPTVKPVALMRHLIRLVLPPGGIVLDPYAGSGTTLVAAIREGAHAVGCELSPEYVRIIEARTTHAIATQDEDA